MPKRAPMGVGNFAELVHPDNQYVFADRTTAIKQVVQDGKVIAFHTFRRGGKTLFASMLQHFFSPEVAGVKTLGLFDTLDIGKDNAFVEKYQGQYPVIMLSFKEVQEDTYESAFKVVRNLMRNAYLSHPELATSIRLTKEDKEDIELYTSLMHRDKIEKQDVENSLKKLTELLHKHHGKKVWVIIDEYDTPLTAAYRKRYLEDMTQFMKNFLSAGLKDNDYLEKGVLTGILRLSKESILSGLNNPKVYTLLNPGEYNPYFGFTEEEVERLFREADLEHQLVPIKNWYNGYQVNHQRLYNPWSIINCIDSKGALKSYWVNTANDALLQDALLNAPADIKAQFKTLLADGARVPGELSELIRFEEIRTDARSLWSLLVAAGYLTVEDVHLKGVGYEGQLRIPNEEIKTVYVDVFSKWLEHTMGGHLEYQKLLKALIKGEVDTFTDLIGNFLITYASVYDLKQENSYHMLVLGLVAALTSDYYLHSNIEAGIGRPDILLIPRDSKQGPALILEFKHTKEASKQEKDADGALAQIDDRHYAAILGKHPDIKDVLKIGMAFCEKSVITRSEWVDLTLPAAAPAVESEEGKEKRKIEETTSEGEPSDRKKAKEDMEAKSPVPTHSRTPTPPPFSS